MERQQLGSRLLYEGTVGYDVLQLQMILQSLGYDPGPIDGIFGPRTKNAVMRFQRDNGLKVDGIVGPETMRVINMLIP
ncbi:Peptidoglycan-binding domain 1 protein [Thermoanaerobacter mathranii subsp. mathranii str. A3]|jgi:peptidoglycan hydrolase-like protein with peptidoglycan-binding domain|uniref:Peptidoglycan-binding domain 1 protein n=8 Tax=Thermoanaerobacter TaxID=1754 RepID=B0KA30_THEP3|nr:MULTISPECIES: peptidoglycan-binding domain-containing protein [Thermoanaerobacter]EGD52407.1 Peptidoglycan-binding domain 1 protein [Thermoanaerobacter ethanolicus JW 200]KUJ90879.1 MAG: peptidoglycan-binding protein [Thermoanaerobacter thermocopriae]KUK34380.1 MAG: Peptidoglycan-binding domain 1 protein [Caldanaerobacter subterraneus]HHW57283.1 peptidoglycan-binding protein [Clostridia bacterium]ABY93094.1 Peptidoglycan-binding domain 1 protein [Thermoanaerobacter sp. X514]